MFDLQIDTEPGQLSYIGGLRASMLLNRLETILESVAQLHADVDALQSEARSEFSERHVTEAALALDMAQTHLRWVRSDLSDS
jgi:hypothetical protein